MSSPKVKEHEINLNDMNLMIQFPLHDKFPNIIYINNFALIYR